MANVSGVDATYRTNIDDATMAEALAPRVLDVMYSATIMRSLAAYESIAGQPTNTMGWVRYPALTAAAVAETADIGNTAINTTKVTATVGEVGLGAALSDVAIEDTLSSVGIAKAADTIGRAIADKQDSDLAALLGGFSTTVGTTGAPVTLTQANVMLAQRELEENDTGSRRLVLVTSPFGIHQFRSDINDNGGVLVNSTPNLDSRFGGGRLGYQFSWLNIDFYATTNVLVEGTSPDYYQSALFVPGETLMFLDKRPVKIEFDRDNSFRLNEIIGHTRYGVAELRDEFGVTINVSGPTP